MSNTILNIRFGYRHLKWYEGKLFPVVEVNSYWIVNKPDPWFKVYQIGAKHFE